MTVKELIDLLQKYDADKDVSVIGEEAMFDIGYKKGYEAGLKDGETKACSEGALRAAYTNCINNGIKRLIPNLRNIDAATLERAGLDTKRIGGYTFKNGEKGGSTGKAEDSGLLCEKCGTGVSQKVASYSQSKFGKILCMDCQKGTSE